MNRKIYVIITILVSAIMLTPTCCDRHTDAWEKMDTAESMMEEHPDSALTILNNLDTISFGGREEKARFALLKSMALDKNYIDTTDFKVLQPAIDYYLKKGTPDEKLRTYYYQGRIYQNRGEDDKAMESFISGRDLEDIITDSLSLARLLNTQGIMFLRQYRFADCLDSNLKAARIFGNLKMTYPQIVNYVKSFDIAILQENKNLSDSIYTILKRIYLENPEFKEVAYPQEIKYSIAYDTPDTLSFVLKKYEGYPLSNEVKLDLAYGYGLLGDGAKAKMYFEDAMSGSSHLDSLKVLSAREYVYESNGLFKDALDTYRHYSDLLWVKHNELFNKDILFVKQRHEIELNNLKQIQEKDRAIGLWAGGVLALLLICGLVYYRYRLGKAKQEISEKEVLRLKLEQVALTKEKERLKLENRNKELELNHQILEAENLQKEKHAIELERNNSELNLKKSELEAENLRLQIAQLEDERDDLKVLLQKSELTDSVKEVIRERLNMLNSLMAKEITNNKNHSRQYEDWVASMRSDSDKFMNSTRLALQASYPNMIEYLKSHGLTEHELNYVCLYAIGLRGKEVGEFTKIKGHYNLSSEIRKKLGLEESDTNLGNFVRGLMKMS